jgi:glycosyltransferase involved in cell wall biosynthesis
MRKVAIVGAHGLYANYGGWDQLVNNLAENKIENEFEYLIFNSSQSPEEITPPEGVKIHRINLKSSGFEGLFYDFLSIIICYFKVDTILFLGVQGMPLVSFFALFKKVNIVSNMGGIEWERPKFGFFAKQYLKFCFWLGLIYSESIVLDNEHYFTFVPKKYLHKCVVIPYGGIIDQTLEVNDNLILKYPFLNEDYFLSISRSLEDNQIAEICEAFVNSKHKLVLISNFTKSEYGTKVLKKYTGKENIVLINGLYDKKELDLVRRKCKAYIHTHTLCGTAPSLVEMIVSGRPIISFDIPQNRFTLNNQALFFDSFSKLENILDHSDLSKYQSTEELKKRFEWSKIVQMYEATYQLNS